MWLKRPIFLFIAHYRNLRAKVPLAIGAVRTRYLAPTIPICTLHWTLTYLGTSMYIGPHTCMSGYVSAYHGVGKLCILLHTILCHAVTRANCVRDGDVTEWPKAYKRCFKSFHFVVGPRFPPLGGIRARLCPFFTRLFHVTSTHMLGKGHLRVKTKSTVCTLKGAIG